MDLTELENYLDRCNGDKAMLTSFAARYPKLMGHMREIVSLDKKPLRYFGSFPANPIAVQCTVYKNSHTLKGLGQYGVEIRAWTSRPNSSKEWKTKLAWHGENRELWTVGKDAKAKCKRLQKRTNISRADDSTLDWLDDFAKEERGFKHVGLLAHKWQGEHKELFQHHYVTMGFDDDRRPVVYAFMPTATYVFCGWTSLAANHEPLNANLPTAIGEVRWSCDPALNIDEVHGWAKGTCIVSDAHVPEFLLNTETVESNIDTTSLI